MRESHQLYRAKIATTVKCDIASLNLTCINRFCAKFNPFMVRKQPSHPNHPLHS